MRSGRDTSECLSDREVKLEPVRSPQHRCERPQLSAVRQVSGGVGHIRQDIRTRGRTVTVVAYFRSHHRQQLAASRIVPDINAKGADRTEIPNSEARGPLQLAQLHRLLRAPDLPEIYESGGAQEVTPDREPQFHVALEQDRTADRLFVQLFRMLQGERTDVAGAGIDLLRGTARAALLERAGEGAG